VHEQKVQGDVTALAYRIGVVGREQRDIEAHIVPPKIPIRSTDRP
jgi:hypothetical protein